MREFGAPTGEGDAHIERVDHINLAQPWQHFDAGVLFFHSVLDLHTQPSMEVAAPVGLVRSQVLRSADGIVRIALNLVPPAADEDAILPQHIAFAASDVLALARSARERGFRPLDIPANYYDDIEARYDIDPALLDELKDLNVMYDRDESGEFLHFYTPPIGTVFLEVVERRGGYDGYGALNAPVRLAAQYQQRRAAKAELADVMTPIRVTRTAGPLLTRARAARPLPRRSHRRGHHGFAHTADARGGGGRAGLRLRVPHLRSHRARPARRKTSAPSSPRRSAAASPR